MNRIALSFVSLLGIYFLFSMALAIASPKMVAKPHAQCSSKELARRDCELTLKPYKAQLSRLKVTWSDGTWTSIADAPLTEEKYQWDKVNFQKLNGRWFLQYWIWDDGKGEAKVQSLHWIVVELKDRRLIAHVDQIVRKREVRMTQPISYTYDRPLPHSLKKIKGELRWTAGGNVGTL